MAGLLIEEIGCSLRLAQLRAEWALSGDRSLHFMERRSVYGYLLSVTQASRQTCHFLVSVVAGGTLEQL